MAVAAGVVIMAITNSANDRLRGQQTDQDSACDPWEVHDIGLESAGRGGPSAQGGLQSSAIGCRRVCYVKVKVNIYDGDADTGEYDFKTKAASNGADSLVAGGNDFIFSRSDKTGLFPTVPDNDSNGADFAGLAPVNGRNTVDLNGNDSDDISFTITHVDPADARGPDTKFSDEMSFKVHASGNYCIVEDSTQTTANQRQILKSS